MKCVECESEDVNTTYGIPLCPEHTGEFVTKLLAMPCGACCEPEPKKPHWYRMYIGECPVCGAGQGYRERVYGVKPADPAKRYVYLPNTYDGCME